MVGPFGLRPKATMQRRALPLAQALVRRGHTVHLLLPPWSAPEDSGRCWEDEGVRVEHVALPAQIPGLFHAALTWRLGSRTFALHPDVVHYFKPKAYPAFVAQWGRWRRRLGLGATRLVLDTDDWEGPGGWNEREPYGRWARLLFAWQERRELRRADAVTVASRTLEALAWAAGAQPDCVYYLPNGVLPPGTRQGDPAQVRERYALGDGPILLLYTRFAEFGLESLVEIMRQVVHRRADVRLLIVGRGLRGEEEKVLPLFRASGLQESVRYAGFIDPEQLAAHFAASDLAIYPYDDTLINRTKCSVKLGELLAHGLPVVASAVGQNCEYIEHGVSGILVPPGDVTGFAEAVSRLLAEPDLRRKLGGEARRRMVEQYSWDRLAVQAEAAYRSSRTPAAASLLGCAGPCDRGTR